MCRDAPELTVVIPTYNQAALLAECLDSLGMQTYQDFNIIVVDDASNETLFIPARINGIPVRVLQREKNGGFAAAINTGIAQADSPYLFLLNNDMTLEPDCIERLVISIQSGKADMAAPLVLWRDDPATVQGCGDRQRRNGRPESIGFRCPRDSFHAGEPPFGVSAGAGLYRREIFDRVGLFDERFVAYFEDSDLNFRARLAGFRAVAVPEAVAFHVGSASIAGRAWWRARQCYQNHLLLVVKNMPASLVLRHLPAILRERFHQAGALISAARTEFGLLRALAIYLGANWEMKRQLPHALFSRRAIQRRRTISLKELEALLRG